MILTPNFTIRQIQELKYDDSFIKVLVTNLRISQWKLAIRQIEAAGFKDDNIIFKFHPQNTQIRHFWSRIKAFLFLHKILQLDTNSRALT